MLSVSMFLVSKQENYAPFQCKVLIGKADLVCNNRKAGNVYTMFQFSELNGFMSTARI